MKRMHGNDEKAPSSAISPPPYTSSPKRRRSENHPLSAPASSLTGTTPRFDLDSGKGTACLEPVARLRGQKKADHEVPRPPAFGDFLDSKSNDSNETDAKRPPASLLGSVAHAESQVPRKNRSVPSSSGNVFGMDSDSGSEEVPAPKRSPMPVGSGRYRAQSAEVESAHGGNVFGSESDSEEDTSKKPLPFLKRRQCGPEMQRGKIIQGINPAEVLTASSAGLLETLNTKSSDSEKPKSSEEVLAPVETQASTDAVCSRGVTLLPITRNPQPAGNVSAPEEDSLDLFMNNLSSKHVARKARIASPPSSDGDDVPPFPDSSDTEETVRAAPSPPQAATGDHAAPTVHRRSLYTPLARHAGLPPAELSAAFASAKVTVSGSGAGVCPVTSFADIALALPRPLLAQLVQQFEAPTPVQSGALPAALLGRDVLATAATGSGKTLAYLVPALAFAADAGGADIPRALVLAPTRELAAQIARVARRLGGPLGLRVALVVGGAGKLEQVRAARNARLIVATPGRLLDLVRMRAAPLHGVALVVLDEADRMLDLGFGPQVADILEGLAPGTQRLLFSATLPPRVRRLAARTLTDPLRVTAGDGPRATPLVCSNVRDMYVPLPRAAGRWQWLREHLPNFTATGLVIVFCRTRGGCAALANWARADGVPVACVHGETEPGDRVGLLRLFRSGDVRVLVTTDLAARGLDISEVRIVVNYEPAKDWEWHVHRAGRTGRADQTGDAYTLLAPDSGADVAFARKALAAFERAKTEAPVELRDFVRGARPGR